MEDDQVAKMMKIKVIWASSFLPRITGLGWHIFVWLAVVAEWLRRLTRNQIPSGSVGSNPTDCGENIFAKFNGDTQQAQTIFIYIQVDALLPSGSQRKFWREKQSCYMGLSHPLCGITARLAQSVEHETLNLRVVGSSPTLGDQCFFLCVLGSLFSWWLRLKMP